MGFCENTFLVFYSIVYTSYYWICGIDIDIDLVHSLQVTSDLELVKAISLELLTGVLKYTIVLIHKEQMWSLILFIDLRRSLASLYIILVDFLD